jgi:hypothetical protein
VRKLIVLFTCIAALVACSNPSPSGYLSGTHQVHYSVTVALGAFTANTLNVDLQSSLYGSTPDTFNNQILPYTSSTYSMNFTGAGAHLTASGSATASLGPASLTMSIWIDDVQKYTSTTAIAAGSGAIATVTVNSPLI